MIKVTIFQVSLAFDSDGSIKVIKICSKQTNFIYFLWDPGSHLCKKLNGCVILYVNFDLVFNLYTVHGVLYNICKISTKFHMQCILFTLASESSCILYLLHILHILNMLQKHFFCENVLVKIYFNKRMSVVTFRILNCDILPVVLFSF